MKKPKQQNKEKQTSLQKIKNSLPKYSQEGLQQ